MARQSVDVKKMLISALLSVGIGLALVVLSLILQLLSLAITDENAQLLDTAFSLYMLILFPLFLGLYIWTGMRAVKRYQFDAVGAAWVAAIAYFITAVIEKILNAALALVIVSRPLGGGGFGSTESAVASSLLGGAVGLSGIGLSIVCGLGLVIVGTMINFVIGGCGALLVLRKQPQSSD
ncbi:MAG: hypothetical protein AB1324_02965 [Candidatus Micrarchaeota archaeon]